VPWRELQKLRSKSGIRIRIGAKAVVEKLEDCQPWQEAEKKFRGPAKISIKPMGQPSHRTFAVRSFAVLLDE
jgi:hypothetical protein